YADYFISLGEFEAKGSAEEDALPKLTFAPANPDPTVTTAMWVPVEYWLARFSPATLEEMQERRKRQARITLFAAFTILLIAAIIAAIPPTRPSDFVLFTGVGIVFYTATELLIALKELSKSLATSIVGTACLIFSIFGLLGMLNI
ncbi:hypothetical protein GYA27_02235, partial [candidate division WWE3 bacterium]|nr:hypothetical protein [candidate division WWE3 bacterium]